jgi:hypothetical protein
MLTGIAVLCLTTATSQAGPVKVLQFTAGATNAPISGNFIVLDHRDLNGKPTLKPIITQYWTGVYNNHPVGVWYITGSTPSAGRWSIYNEDQTTIPTNAVFNVLIPAAGVKVDATPLNSEYYYTAIPMARSNSAAFVYFTHMWNPYLSLGGGVYALNQGLSYGASSEPKNPLFDRWYIFNQDSSLPPPATSYFVFNATKLPASLHAVNLVHTSTTNNIASDYTLITEAGAPTNPTNVVFITPLNYDGNKALGVWWDGSSWTIFNQDQSTFTPGETFNVLFFPAPIP